MPRRVVDRSMLLNAIVSERQNLATTGLSRSGKEAGSACYGFLVDPRRLATAIEVEATAFPVPDTIHAWGCDGTESPALGDNAELSMGAYEARAGFNVCLSRPSLVLTPHS